MRVAIYCRVSTSDQNCERQERELLAYAARCNYSVVGVYKEVASGVKCDRVIRSAVIELARKREIDAIVVSELTRWGRSTIDLITTMQQLAAWGVSLVAVNGFQLDRLTPQGKLLATILSSIAEFERDMINERVRSRLASAKARGKVLGRQPGLTPRVKRLIPKIQNLRGEGMSVRAIARHLQLSKNTVSEVLKTVA